MALTCSIIMNSDREALLKLKSDGSGTCTVTRESLCYKPDALYQPSTNKFQEAYSHTPLKVAFRAIQWSGEEGAKIVCKRNDANGDAQVVLTVVPQCTGTINLSGELGYADSENDFSDLVFEASSPTGQSKSMQLWILVRKNDYHSLADRFNQ